MAQRALSLNTDCIGATDPNITCMGTCRSLHDSIISNCDNEVSMQLNMFTKSVCWFYRLLIALPL